jgi:hypothetical protein
MGKKAIEKDRELTPEERDEICCSLADEGKRLGFEVYTSSLQKSGLMTSVYMQRKGDNEPIIYFSPLNWVDIVENTSFRDSMCYNKLCDFTLPNIATGNVDGWCINMFVYKKEYLRFIIEQARVEEIEDVEVDNEISFKRGDIVYEKFSDPGIKKYFKSLNSKGRIVKRYVAGKR